MDYIVDFHFEHVYTKSDAHCAISDHRICQITLIGWGITIPSNKLNLNLMSIFTQSNYKAEL